MNDIAKYVYEIGQLKRVKRSGWWMAGISNPESIAEHSFRTAILGYVLASLEDIDPMKTAMICLFHDTAEARINDFHRVSKRYIDVGDREEVAFAEQAERLPQDIAKNVVSFMNDYETRNITRREILPMMPTYSNVSSRHESIRYKDTLMYRTGLRIAMQD